MFKQILSLVALSAVFATGAFATDLAGCGCKDKKPKNSEILAKCDKCKPQPKLAGCNNGSCKKGKSQLADCGGCKKKNRNNNQIEVAKCNKKPQQLADCGCKKRKPAQPQVA